eukprot:Nk52_evm18s252 gene=Nk52_evmTU18s252
MIRKRNNNRDDYKSYHFTGKEEQMTEVQMLIKQRDMIPDAVVFSEVAWFYEELGIEDTFFRTEPASKIAEFVMSIYAAKILAYTKNKNTFDIQLEHDFGTGSIFICNSQPGVSVSSGPEFERVIDHKYLDSVEQMPGFDSVSKNVQDHALNTNALYKTYRVETYRSAGYVSEGANVQLRCYFTEMVDFGDNAKSIDPYETNVEKIGSVGFLTKATQHTKSYYSEVLAKAVNRSGPVIEEMNIGGSDEYRVVIAYRSRSTENFFAALSDLYHYYGLYSSRKYVEQFSNGMTIISLYLNQVVEANSLPVEKCVYQFMKEVSLLYLFPFSPFQKLFHKKTLSVQEITYAYCGVKFAEHFLNRLGSEYSELQGVLDSNNESHNTLLNKLKMRLRLDTFSAAYILETALNYPELIKILFANFAKVHHINDTSSKRNDGKLSADRDLDRTLSSLRLSEMDLMEPKDLLGHINKVVQNTNEYKIFECFLTFNKHILKTNFFQQTKVALSFRLDTGFLPKLEYPEQPYGMFFVIGNEFRGFHVRFADVARGGIRIVRSPNESVYAKNVNSLFDENYNLASTQQRKNKDIPEGGSKGTILLDPAHQGAGFQAFRKYTDAILDVLLTGQTPGIKDAIVDKYKKEEILFFGPDEGTADYMDWASQHAKKRHATFWKAFTTGKSTSIGGIPHDLYGMTTRSVHQYVLGIMEKLGIDESSVTKLQTGGPDGDLGSNEILISKDRTIGIVDGSGVLCDPEGIDREEMTRLAKSRMMIKEFNRKKLSPRGFVVLIEDTKAQLPDGTIVENGMHFRNVFHLNNFGSATLFVPCGGRPEAVSLSNVHLLYDADTGEPRFKYICEGANLFFTQQARLKLESSGVVLFKDASTNKGGVTSSSFEVFIALAMSDSEFAEHMCVPASGSPPPFYQKYVQQCIEKIEQNARNEFECIWKEHERSGTPRCIITDQLSGTIVNLQTELEKSALWENESLRRLVLTEYCPDSLLDLIGLDTVVKRVPTAYLKAIFGCYLASRFVYKHGLQSSPFAFYEFMQGYVSQSA